MSTIEIEEDVMMNSLQMFFDKAVEIEFQDLPLRERLVYVIFDIVTLCQNGGISPWIHYHQNDLDMIQSAYKAFCDIEHPEASEILKRAISLHLVDEEHKLDEWKNIDDYFFDKPCELYLGAYNLLVNGKYLKVV